MIGTVVSTKMKNTATILVERLAMHHLYKKTYVQSRKFLVDDPYEVRLGDIVEVIKVRPISKNKHWKIIKVLGKNLAEIAEAEMKEKAAAAISEVMPEEKEEEKSPVDSSSKQKGGKKRGSTQK